MNLFAALDGLISVGVNAIGIVCAATAEPRYAVPGVGIVALSAYRASLVAPGARPGYVVGLLTPAVAVGAFTAFMNMAMAIGLHDFRGVHPLRSGIKWGVGFGLLTVGPNLLVVALLHYRRK